ncbi:MAG: sodium:solute symporter [Verrucomicrobiae bacterium]|nr:sodium:solute symporter [Verrucomicrobiae bacterium]MDW8308739.1 sodium:solute symporter [Verrucomicrobiales bacterium]
MNIRWLDLGIIVAYMAAVAWIGWRCAHRQTTTESYFVARRSVPHWAMAFSFFATLISSITFIAYPGSSYAGNWGELVPGFMVLGVLALVGLVVIPFFREAVGVSAYEFFGRRFGYGARAYTALGFSLGHFSKMGFVFYLLALTIHSMTGWNIYVVIAVAGVVTIFYTLLGGLEAVIWTEVLQGIVMFVGIFVVLGVLLVKMPGGVGAAFELAREQNKFSLGSFDFDLAQKGFWVMSLYGFFWYLQKYTGDQTIVQRYLVARSDREALKGVSMGALMCLPTWTVFMLIGTLVWAFFRLSGEVLPPHIDKPDEVFPHFLTTHVPQGLAGLFMAALFAAGMSTLASDLNCLSAVMVEDYFRKLAPGSTDRQRLVVGKIVVALCGAAAVATAVLIAAVGERALSLYFTVSSILTGGIAGLFLLAFLSPRANRGGAWVGIIACILFTGWATLTSGKERLLDLGGFNFTWPGIMIGVIGHVVVLVTGYVGSFFFAPPPAECRGMTLWGWLQRRKTAPAAVPTPARLPESGTQ